MISAGDFDRKITIERNTEGAENAFGEPSESWATFHETFASRSDVRDSEKVAAGQVEGSLMSRFVIRHCTDAATINPKDRLVCDGLTWAISGVKELSPERRKRYLEITASTGND